MGTGLPRDSDADLLLAVLDAARHDDPGPAVPWALLEGLQRLVPCDWDLSYQQHRRDLQSLLLQFVAADGTREVVRSGPEGMADPWWQFWWSSACGWPERTGERVRRADPVHALRRPEVTGELVVSMPAPPGEARCFLLVRSSGTPFDERDRRVLELLRPHLHEVWLDADRRRAGVPALSPREWEVLALAGEGLSTAEIAVALWISAGTARKHMEHIREKLGVHSIAAAAARALPHAPRRTEVPWRG